MDQHKKDGEKKSKKSESHKHHNKKVKESSKHKEHQEHKHKNKDDKLKEKKKDDGTKKKSNHKKETPNDKNKKNKKKKRKLSREEEKKLAKIKMLKELKTSSSLVFPSVQTIGTGLIESAKTKLAIHEQNVHSLGHPLQTDKAILKDLRKAYAQVQVMHDFCAHSVPSKIADQISKFVNVAGSMNDKIRQKAGTDAIVSRGKDSAAAYSKLTDKHLEFEPVSRSSFFKKLNKQRDYVVNKSRGSGQSENLFHNIRYVLREIMYIHKAIVKLKPLDELSQEEFNLHVKCYHRLEDASEKMGQAKDANEDKGTPSYFTAKTRATIRWYSKLTISEGLSQKPKIRDNMEDGESSTAVVVSPVIVENGPKIVI
jgi:hypothetical protein